MRYEILHGYSGTFAAVDTSRPEYIRHVCRGTEAEASICAFALNAVANGDRLVYMTDSKNTGEPGLYGSYDGPTEGVAPHG